MRVRWVVPIAIAAIVASGCVRAGADVVPSGTASATPTPEPSLAAPTATIAPTPEVLPSDLDPKIAHAIDMRRGAGLRYDLDYVLASMSDPRAKVNLLDFPLYPEEEAKLLADQADQDVAVQAIQAYAADHADEFAGLYVDRDEHPGVVTALWTGHLELHERAISEALGGRLVLHRLVRYGYADLQAITERIKADQGWMKAIPARMWGLGVHERENIIVLEVSSAEPTAVQQIEDHYHLGDQLRVVSDGTGAMLIPAGWVKGRVIPPGSKRIDEDAHLMLDSTSSDPGHCGGGDIGFGIAHDGTFEYPCQAGTRTILVLKSGGEDGDWYPIGSATVKVRAGKTVKVTIHLTEAP